MLARNKAAIRGKETQRVDVRKQLLGILLLVTVVFVLLSTGACNDRDRPGTPESETSSAGVFVTPDADELVIPTISESQMDGSMRRAPGLEPSIRVEGSSIIYLGNMSATGYDRLMRLAEQGNTSELAITSPGGSVYWGIKIGEVVYENGWDVHVRSLCVSSCANYIFPAGRNKVIEDGGVVSWHGSARQDYFFAERNGISVRKWLVDKTAGALLKDATQDPTQDGVHYTDQEGFNRVIARLVAESEALNELERAFYERIGVDADLPLYGHFPQRLEAIQGSGGWTFTLEDMAKFGLDGIAYEGSDAYPSDRARALHSLVLIEVDDR